MAQYRYKGRSAGQLTQGIIEAGTVEQAAAQLANTGVIPLELVEHTETDSPWSRLSLQLGSGEPDLVLFSRQMYTLMKAGVPITRSLNGLIESTNHAGLREALADVLSNLESGHELANSLGRHPKIFAPLFVSMIRVGENTGRLDEAFMRISRYLELERETKKRIKAALRYPTMVIVAIGIAIGVINVMVIPAFATIFEKAGKDLPWQTQALIATSDFMLAWWPVLLGALAVTVTGLRYWVKTEQGRYLWDKYQLRIPLVGGILHRATLSRFSRAFAMALTSGVPLIQALTVVSGAIGNVFIAEHVLSMRNGIERGDTITRMAAQTGQFTPLVLQMLAVGEETGALDNMLEEVAGFYEAEVDNDVRNLSSAIEPILTIAVAGLVLILALGVFLPMWDMSSTMIRPNR